MGEFMLQPKELEGNQLSAAQFYDHYHDEMIDLINDSDNIVKIKMLIGATEMIKKGFVEVNVIRGEIFPVFLKIQDEINDNIEA